MKRIALLFFLAATVLLCGCRVASLGKSVFKNQENTAEGIMYSDTLITNDGKSRLIKTLE